MINVRIRKTIKVEMQTIKYLDNLEKRIHAYHVRLTELEFQALKEEAREADTSVAAIVRARLFNP